VSHLAVMIGDSLSVKQLTPDKRKWIVEAD
jgi:hypothetical protein